jgi:hypothetical protein
MGEKKRFLLRLDGDLYAVMEKWAADELRSVNAQMEFLLVEARRRAASAGSSPLVKGAPLKTSAPPPTTA